MPSFLNQNLFQTESIVMIGDPWHLIFSTFHQPVISRNWLRIKGDYESKRGLDHKWDLTIFLEMEFLMRNGVMMKFQICEFLDLIRETLRPGGFKDLG